MIGRLIMRPANRFEIKEAGLAPTSWHFAGALPIIVENGLSYLSRVIIAYSAAVAACGVNYILPMAIRWRVCRNLWRN